MRIPTLATATRDELTTYLAGLAEHIRDAAVIGLIRGSRAISDPAARLAAIDRLLDAHHATT